jgi:hypothetical protein
VWWSGSANILTASEKYEVRRSQGKLRRLPRQPQQQRTALPRRKEAKKKTHTHRQTRKLAKRGTSGTCAVNVGFVHMEKKTKQNKKLGNFGEMFEP